jgi:hypothetical protein
VIVTFCEHSGGGGGATAARLYSGDEGLL